MCHAMFVTTYCVINYVKIIFLPILLALLKPFTLIKAENCFAGPINCVCSYEFLKIDLRETILSSDTRDLIPRLQSYQCQQFRLLPDVLQTGQQLTGGNTMYQQNSNLNYNPGNSLDSGSSYYGAPQSEYYYPPNIPRKRKKRQISDPVDTQRARLDSVVHSLPSEQGQHSYAFLGHRIQLPCNPTMNNKITHAKFTWIHNNGDPVYAPGVTLNEETGTLTIPAVQLSDIDTYQCHEKAPDGQNATTTHQLSVVTDSIHWLSITAYYQSHGCFPADMQEIQAHLKIWIETFICPICTVHDSSVICDAGRTVSSQYVIQFALTAFNFENEIDARLDLGLCPEMCLQAIHILLLTIVADSVRKLFSRPRYFSERGESDCVICPHGSYQSALAASRCIPCKEGDDTIDNGATSSSACLPLKIVEAYHTVDENRESAVAAVVILVILLLTIVVGFVLCCCFPHSKLGLCLRSCCCFPCKLVSKKKESDKVVQVSKTYIAEIKQDAEDTPKIQETKVNEFTAFETRAPKRKSWNKITRSKLPHMWSSSKPFEYTPIADDASFYGSNVGGSDRNIDSDENDEIIASEELMHHSSSDQQISYKTSAENRISQPRDKIQSLEKQYTQRRKDYSAGHEIQNQQRKSLPARIPVTENFKRPHRHSTGGRYPPHEFPRSMKHSTEYRPKSKSFDQEIQNSHNKSSGARHPLANYDFGKPHHHSKEGKILSPDYEFQTPKQSTEYRSNSFGYEFQNLREQSTVRPSDGANYGFEKSPKHSYLGRNPPIDTKIQRSPKLSAEHRQKANTFDHGTPNPRMSSFQNKKKSFVNYESPKRGQLAQEVRNSSGGDARNTLIAYWNSNFEESSKSTRIPICSKSAQTRPDELPEVVPFSRDRRRGHSHPRTDSCERCFKELQKYKGHPISSKRFSVEDDEALCNVRVRDTIDKMNAASSCNRQTADNDMYSQGRNRRDCSKDTGLKGGPLSRSRDYWQPEQALERWDHNCHRCIKPSLRQSRFGVPPPIPK